MPGRSSGTSAPWVLRACVCTKRFWLVPGHDRFLPQRQGMRTTCTTLCLSAPQPICAAGSRGMSPHVVNLAGHSLHIPRHSPLPLRLPRQFRHQSLICACAGVSPSAADRSVPAKVCQQGFHSIPSSVYVGCDTGVSGFSYLFGLSVSVPRYGCYFGCEVGRCSQC